jgi:hypothetical protein
METIKDLLFCLIPMYVTDRVALNNTNGVWSVVCLESEVQDDDHMHIDAYGTIRTFTWFNVSRGGKVRLD